MKTLLMLAFWSIVTASVALADGDGPTRAMNKSEASAFNDLQKALKAALPQAAANYTVSYTGFDNREIYESATPDKMHGMTFKALYKLNPDLRETRQQEALMGLIQGNPDQQTKRATLATRIEELKKARKSTRDPAEKERIRAEIKKLNAEENALTDEMVASARSGGWNKAMSGVDKTLPAKELSVNVQVNRTVHVQDIAKPYPVAGASFAFEQGDKCQEGGAHCITVLLGNFVREKKISGTTQYTLQDAKLGVPTKPCGLALVVSGPKEKADSVRNFFKGINISKLQALLP